MGLSELPVRKWARPPQRSETERVGCEFVGASRRTQTLPLRGTSQIAQIELILGHQKGRVQSTRGGRSLVGANAKLVSAGGQEAGLRCTESCFRRDEQDQGR